MSENDAPVKAARGGHAAVDEGAADERDPSTTEVRPAKKIKKEDRPRDPALWVHRTMNAYRKTKHQVPFRPDESFFDLADPVIQAKPKRTLLGYDRFYVFWQSIRNVLDIPGDVAEIGSYRGGSAYFIASVFLAMSGVEVPMHVFDTFEGHPEGAITEHDDFHTAGRFGGTNYDRVRKYLSVFRQLTIHKGDVSLSLPHLEEARYRLVHIDTDLYKPTIDCLQYFGPRLSSGGIVILDDYASANCPGVPKAVADYLATTNAFQVWDVRTEQLVLVKKTA